MRTGLLRVSYWALEEGRRAELLATLEQDEAGQFAPIFCSDPRPIDAVLELGDKAQWREVRARRLEASALPRLLPTP